MPVPVRTWAWAQLAQIYANIEHPDDEVEQIVAQGLDWFERTDQVPQGHRLRLIRGRLWLEQGRTEDALAELREALALRRRAPSDDIPPLSTYLEAIARPLCSLERWVEAEPFCIELANEEGVPVPARAWTWAQLAQICANIEHPDDEVEQIVAQGLDWFELTDQTHQGHRLRLIRGQLWLEQGRTEDALSELRGALALRRRVPSDDIPPLSTYLEAIARPLCSLERWVEAEPFCVELANEEGASVSVRTWAWLQLGQIYADIEHPDDEVEQVVAQGLDWFGLTDQTPQGHRLRLIRGQLWLEQGRTEDALAELREALDLRRLVPSDDMPLLSTYLEAITKPLCSLERWEEAQPFCIELTDEEGAPVSTRAWAWGQLAQIYIDTERPDEAEHTAQQALTLGDLDPHSRRGTLIILARIWLERGYAVLHTSPQEISSRERRERVMDAHRETLRWLDEATAVADVVDDGKIGQLQEKANTLIEQLFALQWKEPSPGVEPGETWRVFVSSTIKDLDAYRQAVLDSLKSISRMQVLDLSMETMGSQPGSPQEVSLERVEACDLFVGLYAGRYGHVPLGSDRSITEQEFDHAHKFGKRCLCYFADPSVEFPPDSIEADEEKIVALQAFKDRISEALVSVAHFKGPDHLASLVAGDIADLLSGDPLGFDPEDFRIRCASAAERRATRLWQDLRGSADNAVPSPLEKVWGDFVSQTPWHERIRVCGERCQARLKELMKETGDGTPDWIKKLHQQFRDLHYYDVNYVGLIRVLRRICAEDMRGQFSRLRWKSRDRPEVASLCEEIEARLTHLAREVEFPLYQRCLLIRGEPGGGKTQFVFQLLDGKIRPAPYVPVLLRLPHDEEKNLKLLVLRELRQVSGYGWRTLDEVNRFLERYSLRMVFIVDGLQRWVDTVPNFVGQLKELIEEHSGWHSLHWLVTARDRSLQPFRGGQRFWLEYGFRSVDQWWQKALEPIPPTGDKRRRDWLEKMGQPGMSEAEVPHVGGWISLSDLNREEEVGLKIVNEQTERAVDFTLMEAASRRHVCVPFIAWIVVDLIHAGATQLSALRNLRFISFVKRFWNLKREQIKQMPRGEEIFLWMEQAVAWIADYCVRHNTSKELRAKLLDTIVKQADGWSTELTDREQAKRILIALELENLLEWFWALRDGIPVEFEELKFDTFWQYRLADRLYYDPAFQNQDLESARTLLEKCFPTKHEPGTGLQEGMLEFLFLILDDTDTQRMFVEELLQFALQLLPTWRQAIWYAGTKGKVQLQQAVMGWAVEHGTDVAGEQDIFAMLYFLRDLEDRAATLTTRFRLLSPHYSAIAEYGLEAMFWDLARRWFARPFETDDILGSLIYLHGTEQMGLGEDVAWVSFAALKEHAEAKDDPSKQMRDWMLNLLTNVKNQIDWPPSPPPWWRERYLEWLLCDFCQWFAGREGLKAYYMLDERGWFQWDEWRPLSLSMEREATIALGYACRKYFSDAEREEYEYIISELLRSQEKNDVVQAFYMTWHADWRHPLFKDVREQMQTEPYLESRRDDPQYEEFFS